MRGLHAIFTNMFAGQGLVRAATAAAATGTVVPTAPGPGDVFKQGGDCTFSWTPDPSGTWKQTDVELMTGDNFNMVFITTITSFDGTDASKTTFSYPCPEVTPNSAIYFYQFSSPAVPDRQWTTRFTIADASGASTPPTNATQPGAPPGSTPIPWGTGALVDPSKVVAAPSYLGIPSAPGASGSGTLSVTASATASGSVSASSASGSSASSAASVTVTASAGSSSGAGAGTTTAGTTSAAAVTQTSTVSTAPAAPTSSSAAGNGTSGSGQNGAVGVRARLGPAVLALGLAAVGFAVAF